MSIRVYANLAPMGWTELTSETTKIESFGKLVDPATWWEESANIYAPVQRKEPDTLYEFPYTHVHYKDVAYRVSPYHFQIVHD